MKILLDVSQIAYSGTGSARYTLGLVRALLEAHTPHTFHLFAGAFRSSHKLIELSKTPPYDRATWKILPIPPKLARVIFNKTNLPIETFTGVHDLFHTSDWTEPHSAMPKVTTIHDLIFRLYPETVDELVRNTQTQRLDRIVTGSTHVIVDSMNTKNDLMKIYSLPDSRIDVVYPGVDRSFTRPSNQEIDRVKNKYHLTSPYLLCVGTQEPRKNLGLAISAFNLVKKRPEFSSLSLVIAGKYGWGEQVKVGEVGFKTLGFVVEADLPGLYAGAEVFVFPSLYEGFGFPVLEAMACGTPVVAINVASQSEIVGQAGVLVDKTPSALEEGIVIALQSPAKYRALGLAQAQKFTWDNCAKETIKVYERIVSKKT